MGIALEIYPVPMDYLSMVSLANLVHHIVTLVNPKICVLPAFRDSKWNNSISLDRKVAIVLKFVEMVSDLKSIVMMETLEQMMVAMPIAKSRVDITAKEDLQPKLAHVFHSFLIDHTSQQQAQYIYSVELFKVLD